MKIIIEYTKRDENTQDKHFIKFDKNISRNVLYHCISNIKKLRTYEIYIGLENNNDIVFYEKYYNVGYKDSFDELYDYLKLFNQLNK